MLPYCCVNFKRHNLFKNGINLVKVWYYCKIEGCVLNGTATLDKSFSLTIFNKNTELKHEKGKQKSFESRNIRGDRKNLGEKVADMAFPSKYFHRKLASLDEKLFSMGNLRDVPQSKSVVLRLKVLFPHALNLH